MEIELFTSKGKERFVNVQEVRFVERTILIRRADENKHYFFPLATSFGTIENGETSDGKLWFPKKEE
jgi:hypothetical protein